MHKGFFTKALRRLRITPIALYHHGVKILVHINPKSAYWTDPSFGGLDRALTAMKLAAGFLE